MLLFEILKDILNATALAIVILAGKVNSKFCNGGHICSPPKECCPLGCCLVFASPGYRPNKTHTSENASSVANFLLWNHWILWILLVFFLLVFFCGCGLWKKRQLFSNRLYRRTSRNEGERFELGSTGNFYPPPQYSRCSSFHYAPPPYTEVTSKPDLYPLVISYKSDNGKFGENRVMVQYFKNYVVHPALIQDIDSNYPPSYEESRIGEQNQSDLEPVHSATQKSQSDRYSSQAFLTGDTVQIDSENNHHSMQKGPDSITDYLEHKQISTPRGSKVLANAKEIDSASQKLYLSAVDKIFFQQTDSNYGRMSHPAHHYTSDIILAQPQRYCDSSNDLLYDSCDILNNFNHYLLCTNDSYSSEDNLSQPRGSLQDFVSSDGLSYSQFSNLEATNFFTSSEISSLQNCGSLDSPPRATSPTGEFRNLLEKIQLLPSDQEIGNKNAIECSTKHEPSPSPSNNSSLICNNEMILSVDEDHDSANQTESSSLLEKANGGQDESVSDPARLNKSSSTSLNLPKRSKTLYLSFCPKGPSGNSLRSLQNFKSSNSAPVTPINPNFTSLGSFSLHFLPISNKLGSKITLGTEKRDDNLLHEECEEENEPKVSEC